MKSRLTHTASVSSTDRYVWQLFFGFAALYAAASYLTNEFVLTDEMLKGEWSEKFDADRVLGMLEHRRRWAAVGYAAVPVTLSLKIVFSAMCIAVGCAVIGWSFRFRELLRIAVHAEIVFAAAALVHLAWSLFARDFGSLSEYAGFYPLSALHFVTIDPDKLWMAYPLKTLNVFEVAYVGALAIGLERVTKEQSITVLTLVTCSYGTGLLLLVSAVTFLSLYLL